MTESFESGGKIKGHQSKTFSVINEILLWFW